MKEGQLLRVKVIKTEADLPKERGDYECLFNDHKTFGKVRYDNDFAGSGNIWWINKIDWYLQPIDEIISIMDTKDKLIGVLKEADNLLSSAKCPDCDGNGIILSQTVKTGTKWVDDGHGNPLPEPYPIINHNQSQCFWCYHKDNLLSEIATLEKQIKEQESKRLTDAEITAKAKIYARDHSEAPDKDCPMWIEHDYCAGAVMAREFYTGVIQDLGEEQFKNK